MKIRTLIVDDEPLARRNLRSLLDDQPDFEIAGECGDGPSGTAMIATLRPDLVFLDIQMPKMNGFEVVQACTSDILPAVVFVTAYDAYALKAFDVQALDYLLKPFHIDRFHSMLARVRQNFTATHAAQFHRNTPAPISDRMVVKCGDRFVLIPFDELQFVKARANYVRLIVGDTSYDIREKMSAMEDRLPPNRFLRIHRSYIVNLTCVRELTPAGDGDYLIVLQNGRHLPVGPTYTDAVRLAMGVVAVQ